MLIFLILCWLVLIRILCHPQVSQQQQLEGNGKEEQQQPEGQPEGKGKEAASTEKNPYEDDYDVNAFLYPLLD